VPVLLLGLLVPVVLLFLMLAMERVEEGLSEDRRDRRTRG
jgi:hypothetical protein